MIHVGAYLGNASPSDTTEVRRHVVMVFAGVWRVLMTVDRGWKAFLKDVIKMMILKQTILYYTASR